MGSAKEPGSLQLLGQGAVAEDVCRPENSSPGCLHSSRCGAGQLTMRNCCVPELSGQGSQERRAEAPAMDKPLELEPELEPAAGGRALVLQGTCAGAGPPEKGEESLAVAVSCLGRNGERRSGPPAPPDGSSIPRSLPAGDGAAVASAEAPSPRLLPEPCLKGHGKDLASAPAALKHVAFREPANRDPQPDGAGAAAASPELAPVPPTGLQDRRQEQARASQGDESMGAPGAARLSDGGAGAPCGGAGGKVPPSLAELQAQLGSLTAPGAGSKGAAALPSLAGAQESAPGAPGREAASGPEARLEAEVTPSRPIPAPLSRKAGPAGSADARPEACSAATHSVKGHGPSGESRAAPAEAGGGTGLPQSTAEGSPAQEQRRAKGTEAGPGEEAVWASRTVELLSKTYSLEVTPPPQDAGTQDAGTQAGTRVSLVSVAVSPINPPDGSMAFTFHSRGQGPSALASPGPELKPSKKDAEMQVSIPVESRSVATGPMTPVAKSPQASYPEVRVKGAQEEPPEPIREVSWDEKGMTWEVYGASVEVEVLGMAIQKHLEKQIEEHGRQTVMTPQSTRASSIKGAPRMGEVKRPPTMFRALLQGMRRPRCCSRAGPAAE